jgi:hypothetical protein
MNTEFHKCVANSYSGIRSDNELSRTLSSWKTSDYSSECLEHLPKSGCSQGFAEEFMGLPPKVLEHMGKKHISQEQKGGYTRAIRNHLRHAADIEKGKCGSVSEKTEALMDINHDISLDISLPDMSYLWVHVDGESFLETSQKLLNIIVIAAVIYMLGILFIKLTSKKE